jgi:tetratricopeptide (TPR) repeat protein
MAPLDVHVAFKAYGFYLASFVDGDYPSAIDATARALREYPANVTALRYRAAALALAGRTDEARRTVAQLLAVVPEMTIARCRRHVEIEMKNPFRLPELRRHITRAFGWLDFLSEIGGLSTMSMTKGPEPVSVEA